ncbi:MAG: ABC transporter ATP-binding protein [Treponema sp.]|nr:ABC transporter ATP-binding protein [Treponema sp.]
MDDENVIVQIEGLEKNYVNQSETLRVLKGLSLTIKKGERVCITGESGNGKSTLLNILGGIDTASGGVVKAGGDELSALDEDALTEYRARFVGLVFQFHYLLKDFSALENVFLPAYMAGMHKSDAMKKAEKLLEDVGLSHRKNHLPSELSGGERQRVAVARALVNDPSLVLADEPTGNLDPANAAMIGELLFQVAKNYGKTLLVVTHDMDLASRGETLYKLEDGVLKKMEIEGARK